MSKNKVSYEKKVEIVRDYLDGRVGYKEKHPTRKQQCGIFPTLGTSV